MSVFDREIVFKEKPKIDHPWQKTVKTSYFVKIKHVHNSITNPEYPKLKTPPKAPHKFTVIGNRVTKEFIYCANTLKGLHKYRDKIFAAPEIKGLTAVEWQQVHNELKLRFGGDIYCSPSPVVVLLDGKYYGSEKELKEYVDRHYVYNLYLDYQKEAVDEFSKYVKSSGRPFAYMHFEINSKEIGAMIFMLYADLVPKTCQNFLRLCKEKRGGYGGAPVHRIVKEGWVQCGGYYLKGSEMDCENFIVPHDKRGVLAMCNDGRHKDCSTQFFILLQPAPWMAKKYVAFGQLVDGEEILRKIENTPTWHESPTVPINIVTAGMLNLDCGYTGISKCAQHYIATHIEDLVFLGKTLNEIIMTKVWAAIEAKTSKDEESKDKDDKSESEAMEHLEEIHKEEEEKESTITVTSDESEVQEKKLFYLPLADVKYPDEVDSDYDVKRLLQGDYCLEEDLEKNLEKDEKKKEKILLRFDSFMSENFFEDYMEPPTDPLIDDLDSSEEEELKNYIKNNVERASFAGGVIRGIVGGNAMLNLFEGARKSEMITFNDDDIKKLRRISMFERRQSMAARKSEIISDETVRKLRRASMFDRRVSQAARRSELPGLDLERLRQIGAQAEEKEPEKPVEDKTGAKKKKTKITVVAPEPEEEQESGSDMEKTDRSLSLAPSARTPSKLIRRPTGFLRPGDVKKILANKRANLKSQGLEVESEEEEEEEDESQPPETISFKPSAKPDKPKRGIFIADDASKEALQSTIAEGSDGDFHTASQKKKRRQTGFLTKEQLQKILQNNDDEEEEEEDDEKNEPPEQNEEEGEEVDKKEEEEQQKRKAEFAEDKELESIKIVDRHIEEHEDVLHSMASDSHVSIDPTISKALPRKIARRPTAFVPIQVSSDSDDELIEKSVLRRLYDDSKQRTTQAPTLKNYRPITDMIKQNLFLTFGEKQLQSEIDLMSKSKTQLEVTRIFSDSLEKVVDTQFGKKSLGSKVSLDYIHRLSQLEKEFREPQFTLHRSRKRPTMTVSDYQKMNKKRQKEMEEN